MDEREEAIREALERARQAYRQKLPLQLAELDDWASLFEGAASPSDMRDTLKALHYRLHKLAGSCGTFGYKCLGYQARQLEQTAAAWLEGDAVACRGAGKAERSAFVQSIRGLSLVQEAGEPFAAL